MRALIPIVFWSLVSAAPARAQEPVFPFTDVPAGHWARPAIEALVASGMIDAFFPEGDGPPPAPEPAPKPR